VQWLRANCKYQQLKGLALSMLMNCPHRSRKRVRPDEKSMKPEHQMPVAERPIPVVTASKREPSLLKLLRMRNDFARRQRVTDSWAHNLNLVSPQS